MRLRVVTMLACLSVAFATYRVDAAFSAAHDESVQYAEKGSVGSDFFFAGEDVYLVGDEDSANPP